jgi:hypothetical protein
MYVAMICLLGEFVCAVCGFARSPNNEHARGGAMRATTHTVGPQATFAAPFVGFRFRPRLCENSGDRFLPVNFSHVDALSGESSDPICLLAILRGEQNAFAHSLGQ